ASAVASNYDGPKKKEQPQDSCGNSELRLLEGCIHHRKGAPFTVRLFLHPRINEFNENEWTSINRN
ncbi:9516_t:CDS:2, partial [Acaulospora morrowiae]